MLLLFNTVYSPLQTFPLFNISNLRQLLFSSKYSDYLQMISVSNIMSYKNQSIKPLNFFAVAPQPFPLHSILVAIYSSPILLTVLPVPYVSPSVRPDKLPIALLLLVDIFSFIFPTVSPDKGAFPMHFIVLPEALKLPPVHPDIPPVSLNVVCLELALIFVAIKPCESPMSFLHTLDVVSLVLSSISPFLVAIAVLLVIVPLSGVGGAVLVEVDSPSLSLVVEPLSLIYISSCLNEAALTVGHVISPVAFIKGAIFPDLPAHASPFALFPLAVVDGPVVKFNRGLGFVVEGLREVELSKSLIGVFDGLGAYFGKFLEGEGVWSGLGCGEERDSRCVRYVLASLAVSHVQNFLFPLILLIIIIIARQFHSNEQQLQWQDNRKGQQRTMGIQLQEYRLWNTDGETISPCWRQCPWHQ